MSFSSAKNVRIKSLTPGAVVQLRVGKTANKSESDTTITAKLLRHEEDGPKSIVVFEETDSDGRTSETVISRFPGASWRLGSQYVSLLFVDESTFTIERAASPIRTEVIGEAIALISKESDDVYGAEQLIALLTEIQGGKRVNTKVKSLANKFANKVVDELGNLPPKAEPDQG